MIFEAVWTAALFLGPGYLLACLDEKLQGASKVMVSALNSTLIYCTMALTANILGIPMGFHIVILCWLFALAPFAILRPRLREAHDPILLRLIVIGAALRLMLWFGNPEPRVGDSFTHFEMSKSFLEARWYTTMVLDNYWTEYLTLPHPGYYRPPLQDLLHGIAMMINAPTYPSAAAMSMLFGLLSIVAIWAIAREYFGDNAAYYACSLACVNYFMIERSVELEPRLMLSFFILSFIFFSSRGREYWLYASLCAAFAWLTHYSAIWFLLAAVSAQGYMKGDRISNRYVIWGFVFFIVLISPWLLRNHMMFGNPLFSTASHVPFMTGWEDYFLLEAPTPSSYIKRMGGGWAGVGHAAGARAINILTTYIAAPNRVWELGMVWGLSNSLISLVGPLAFYFAAAYIIKNRSEIISNPLIATVVFCSLIGPMFTGYPKSDGVSVDMLSPLIPIYIVLAAAHLDQKGNRKLFSILIVSLLIQTFWLSDERFKSFKQTDGLNAVREGVPQGNPVMSYSAYRIRHYTQRPGAITPNAEFERIIDTMRELGIRYYALNDIDTVKRDIDDDRLLDVADLIAEEDGVRVYRLRGGN